MKYEKIISELTDKFKNSIDYDENLIDGFKNYLYMAVKSIEEFDFELINKDEKAIESFLISTTDELISLDMESKQRELLIDEAFEKIRQTSGEIFNEAKNILNGDSKVEYDTSEKKEEIIELLKSVKKFNREEAKKLVSETILDLEFISNPKMNINSLRIGRTMRSQVEPKESNLEKKEEER